MAPRVLSSWLSRRRALQALGLGAGAIPFLGCSSPPGAGPTPDAPPLPVDAAGGDNCGPAAGAWAMGGTAAMTAKACYPDPFAAAVVACPLVLCPTTAGPCTATAPARQDVSEGYPGLPVRLALKLVTAGDVRAHRGCGRRDLAHPGHRRVLGRSRPPPAFCAGGDADAPNHSYFRGTQTSDASGRVDFDTCFPGWYPGRAIHIHFSVTVGGASRYRLAAVLRPGADRRASSRPTRTTSRAAPPDTSNASDGIVGGGSLAPYLVDAARMSDGAMLASKVIAIRAAGQPNCST